jgi:hypothetical protein
VSNVAFFSRGADVFILFASRDAIDRTPTIFRGTLPSCLRQGDSEILAIRKTDAWVLRLLPPTS